MATIKQFLGRLLPLLPRSVRSESELHKEQIQFLLNEVSDLRAIVRHLAAANDRWRHLVDRTNESFEFQWEELSEGKNLQSDKAFKDNAVALVHQYTKLPPEWFDGKKVLDAGCGNGRWSVTFCKLGAKVTAVDISKTGVEKAKDTCQDFPGFTAFQHNLLEELKIGRIFDLVYAHGVMHHTGYTWQAIQNIAACVKPGGFLFMMIYGEPRLDHIEDYREVNHYTYLRRKLVTMSNDEKVTFLSQEKGAQYLHGWFDAVSPRVNDLHRYDEIAEWLQQLGFDSVQVTFPNRNLNIVGRFSG